MRPSGPVSTALAISSSRFAVSSGFTAISIFRHSLSIGHDCSPTVQGRECSPTSGKHRGKPECRPLTTRLPLQGFLSLEETCRRPSASERPGGRCSAFVARSGQPQEIPCRTSISISTRNVMTSIASSYWHVSPIPRIRSRRSIVSNASTLMERRTSVEISISSSNMPFHLDLTLDDASACRTQLAISPRRTKAEKWAFCSRKRKYSAHRSSSASLKVKVTLRILWSCDSMFRKHRARKDAIAAPDSPR
jgi:hypothetical protein